MNRGVVHMEVQSTMGGALGWIDETVGWAEVRLMNIDIMH